MITKIYIIVCASIFVYINFINKGDQLSCAMKLGAFYPPNLRENHEYWRFLTCNFIHIDFMHFFLNAYALYDLGTFFEQLLGPMSYLFLILVSMILSSLMCYSASQLSYEHDYRITIGASGVVYGFFGAICALGFLLKGPFMSILNSFLWVIIVNVMYTLFNKRVSSTGHLGGFIGGVLGIVIILAMQRILI